MCPTRCGRLDHHLGASVPHPHVEDRQVVRTTLLPHLGACEPLRPASRCVMKEATLGQGEMPDISTPPWSVIKARHGHRYVGEEPVEVSAIREVKQSPVPRHSWGLDANLLEICSALGGASIDGARDLRPMQSKDVIPHPQT